jgi:hypothetical protein
MRTASTSKSLLLALALASAGSAHAAGRVMPPAQVRCDRNQLTSYFGDVVSYKRNASRVSLRIATDYGTVEDVDASTERFLYQGRAFTSADWQRVERKPGVLRKGTRATAWVCSDGKTPPLVDWNVATE